jgi:hypothetical protein
VFEGGGDTEEAPKGQERSQPSSLIAEGQPAHMLLPFLIQFIGAVVMFGCVYLHHFVPRGRLGHFKLKIQLLGCFIGLVTEFVGLVMLFRRISGR